MDERQIEILAKIKQYVQQIDGQSEVILFGSRARGDNRKDSDWDILILTTQPSNLKVEQKYRHKLLELEIEYGEAFSTFVYAKSEWNQKYAITPFYQQIQKDGLRI